MKTNIFCIIFIFVFFVGCKEEFTLDLQNYNPVIVINGYMTDDIGPYEVNISLSSAVNQYKYIPYSGCSVFIMDDQGNEEMLYEVESGVYRTSELGMQGIPGNCYSLYIETPEGNKYKSDFQKLSKAVEIDSVYAKLNYELVEYYPFELPGYQFYVNTPKSENENDYLLWRMEETYEYTANYHLYAIYNGQLNFDIREYDDYYRCWMTQNVNYFYTATTEKLTEPRINKQPLHFVGTDSKRLQVKYSLLLKQYSINKNAYNYWKNIEKQYSEENFLVANQPYNIKGNIENVDDPNEIVFGYFTVGAVRQKRIFVDSPDVPFYYMFCSINEDYKEAYAMLAKRGNPHPFYIVRVGEVEGAVAEGCIDCRKENSTINKPDFWTD